MGAPIGIFGQILGTIVGAATGTVVRAPQQTPTVVTPANQPDPPVEAPAPKPLIKSKTAWFSVLFPVVIMVLEQLQITDLNQYIDSPVVVAAVQSAITIVLRLFSSTGIAIPRSK